MSVNNKMFGFSSLYFVVPAIIEIGIVIANIEIDTNQNYFVQYQALEINCTSSVTVRYNNFMITVGVQLEANIFYQESTGKCMRIFGTTPVECADDCKCTSNGKSVTFSYNVTTGNSILRLTCHADFLSDTIELQEANGPSSIVLSPSTPTYTVIETISDVGPITCSADCRPNCTVIWSGPNIPVGTASVLNLQNINRNQAGDYKCLSTNIVGSLISGIVTLIVNYGPSSVVLSPSTPTYTVIETISNVGPITCSADCRPNCTVIWSGPNIPVGTASVLNLQNINRNQAGNYKCLSTNIVGSLISRIVTLIVNYGATVNSLETDNAYSTVNEGQKVNMTCHVDGIPKPKIVWTLADDVIRNQENKTNYLFTAHCEHTGNYTCTVNNNIAAANRTKEMFVQCYPRVYTGKSTKPKIGLEDDEGLNITVTIIAYPAPHIQWSFQNYTISSNNSFGIFQHTTNLYKPKVDENDFGIYSLSTSNNMGNTEYHILVGVQGSPETANTHSSSPSFADGIGTGLGIAAIIFFITLVTTAFIRIKRKRPPAPSNLYQETECKAGPANIYNELDENKKDGQLELIKRRYNNDSPYMYEDFFAYENPMSRNEDPKLPIKDVYSTGGFRWFIISPLFLTSDI